MTQSKMVTAGPLADLIGIARQSVGRFADQGILIRQADGKFDLDKNRLAYIASLRSRKSATSTAADEFRKLKTREIALRVARYEGTLMDADECFVCIDELIGLVRTIFGGLTAKAFRDPAVRATISNEVPRCLNRLADIAAKKALEVRPDGQPGHAQAWPVGDVTYVAQLRQLAAEARTAATETSEPNRTKLFALGDRLARTAVILEAEAAAEIERPH